MEESQGRPARAGGADGGPGRGWYGPVLCAVFLDAAAPGGCPAAQLMLAVALLLGTPFFIVFGALSDRVGRRPVILLAAHWRPPPISFQPSRRCRWQRIRRWRPRRHAARWWLADGRLLVSVQSHRRARFTSPCDTASRCWRCILVPYVNEAQPLGEDARVRIGGIGDCLAGQRGTGHCGGTAAQRRLP